MLSAVFQGPFQQGDAHEAISHPDIVARKKMGHVAKILLCHACSKDGGYPKGCGLWSDREWEHVEERPSGDPFLY